MPSVVTYDVRSAGANSGTDWNSLKGALSQAQTDYPSLVSSDVQLVFECEAFEDTDSQIDLVSFTTDATRNIIIRAASGADHGGVSEAGYRLKGASPTQFLIRTSYVTLEGIEIWQSGTANSADCIQVNASLSGTTLRNLIIRTDGSGSGANAFVTSSGCTVENVIATNGAVGFYFAVGESVARNCTSVGCNFGFRSLGAVNVTVTNCVAVDSDPSDNFVGTYNAASDYNASEDTSAPGANSVTGISTTDGVDFVSPSTGDYTPAASGALDGAGTDLSADFTDDITGATRTTPWDIGAFAIVGGGGTTLVVQDISHAVTIDGITLTQANVLAAQGIGHTQTVDNATLVQESSISAGGVTQSQAIDNTTLTQASVLAPNPMNQGQSVDPATLTQAHVLVPDGVAQGQSIDAITLLSAGTLDIQSLAQSQTIDEAILTVAGVLSLDGVTQAQTLEALDLVQASVLAPNGITQSQSVDVATLAAASQSVSMDDVSHSQTLDATALTQYHVLSVDSLTQAQVIDVCLFGGLVIGELNGQIVIYAAMGGTVYAIPALSGTIH